MRCSSCIGGRRRSHKRRNDHESATPVKLRKTADSHPGQRMDQHPNLPPGTVYRVESPPNNPEDNKSFNDADEYRPPSITITELDDETFEEYDGEAYATSTSTITKYEDTELENQYHRPSVQSSRAALEIIHEEEWSDCSDSETTHILPSSDREVPTSCGDGNTTKVDKSSSGHENDVQYVTPKYASVNVLRDFLRYRWQSKRRRGAALHNAGPHFQQNEQQVPTTCFLVDAKESNIAPAVYRSICTTEIVNSEVMEAEVINIGSNSSSLDDLSDMESEHREESTTTSTDNLETSQNNDAVSKQLLLEDSEPTRDPSNVTPSHHPDLHQAYEDIGQTPAVRSCNSNGDSTQNRVITENQRLKQNMHNPNEDSTTLAQLHSLPRISDSGHVDDIAKGCALAGDVGADQRERHDVAASSIHNVLHAPVEKMSEHRNTFESSGPDSIVVGSTPEHSSASLLVEDRDRASVVVGNDDENVIKALKDPSSSVIVRDCVPKFDSDRTVNHCVRLGKTPPLVEEIMHRGDQSRGAAIAVKRENQTFSPPPPPPILVPSQVVSATAIPLPPPPKKEDANVTNLGQNTVELAEVDKSDTPPPAQLVPLTVEALSSSTAGFNVTAKNAQAHSGDHLSKTDHADANQNSAQNCVDAVTSAKRPESSKSTVDDQSALLKYIQVNSRSADSSENHYQGKAKNSPNVSPVSTDHGDCLVGDLKRHQQTDSVPVPVHCDATTGEDNVDCAAKIEQAHEDHGGQNCAVSSEAIVVLPPNLRNTDHEILVSGTKTGMNNVSRMKHPSRTVEQKIPSNTVPSANLAGDTFPLERKPTLATDVRTEISRLKDAELQDEFRKLELEAARFERELQQITVPKQASQSNATIECTKNYYVSKQNDFVIQRSSMSSVNNSTTVGVMHGGDNHQQDVQRSNHDNQDMITKSSSATQLHRTGPVPPSPLPPNTTTNPSEDNEEFVVKKVKDRVRDLMASQAAAEATKNEMKMRSAPSTPIVSRKNIEAEFKEFREIRQREAVAERKLIDTKPVVSSAPARQPHANTVRNFSPSRIPLATSKTSTSVSHRKLNDTTNTDGTVAKKSNQDNKAPTEESNSEKIQVNVAALIATHQEKQQLSTLPAVAQVPKIAPTASSNNVELTVPVSNNSAPNGPASDEPVVSVSDKCQQFEQRIRQNSTDGAYDTVTYARKICTNSTALDGQPFQQKPGVWSPFNRSTEVLTKAELAERSPSQNESHASQQPPVWTPRSAPPSPLSERREFRRIGFESPTPTRRTITPSPADPSAVVTPPWNQPGYNPPLAVADHSKPIPIKSSASSGAIVSSPKVSTPPPPPPEQGYQVRFPPLPRSTNSQEPTINSLLKSKDGKTATPKGPEPAESVKKSSTLTASTIRTSSSQMTNTSHQLGSVVNANQTNYQNPPIRHKAEQSSASLQAKSDMQDRQMQQPANKVEGIGPITREGMPLTLRSEIDERNRDKWYKQMYQTLHKTHEDDDYVTVRYKTRRGYPYKSSGYQSEPEANYDSDYSIKYSTLDRRRTPVGLSPTSYNKFSTLQSKPSTPQPYHQQTVKSGHASYKNQPGRIENYTPGRSSISEKESKEWWDEVMDIFNGQLEHQKLTGKAYTEGNLSRALKEQGYESDSTLVFRKREPPVSAALSPVEQKQYYKTMQAGGEIPLQGFRKPAPERPKESPRRYIESDVNIHYKTPIRFEYKEPIPDDELAYRQAEHMRRVYQEERRRKYINELEDMHSRRHMDNILPSQKSPIPLNRYDDFAADLSVKPQIVQQPKTIARALYNFQGQSVRELSFRKGDIIYLRRQIDKNWYEGEHNATVGLLPANYIEILSRDNQNVRPLPKKPSREGKARAKFNFTAQTTVELSLLKGELVTLTRRVDDNWFEGKIGNKKGIFPVSYVEILTDIDGEESYDIEPIAQSALGVTSESSRALTTHYDNSHTNGRISPGIVRETKTIQKTEVLHVDTSNEPISYRALYNYKPQNTDELELLEGDVVYVLEKCDDGWYVGTSARSGCFGTFPGNYVTKL